MRIDFKLEEMNIKQRIFSFIVPLFFAINIVRSMKKIKDYVKGQNLKMKTFSQFGGTHQRNIFSAKQTSSYFFVCTLLVILDNALIILFQLYKEKLDKDNQFLIHNFIWVLTIEGFFGLYVPVKHIILSREFLPGLWWDNTTVQTNKFYVSKRSLSPRRHLGDSLQVMDKSEKTNKNNFSYVNKTSKINVFTKQINSEGNNANQNELTPIYI
jgi:hypothetical protein